MATNETFEKFEFMKTDISRAVFDRRVIDVSGYFGWRAGYRAVRSGIPFGKLNIIEIGCGTGTFCLAFALMGANVTLFDIDNDALETAKQVYALYGLKPTTVRASVTDTLRGELSGEFDMSVSLGLAEHFTGDERIRVIKLHRQLLNESGLTVIGVPNGMSPFYSVVRFVNTVLGQWKIKQELPFTPSELRSIGKKAGYSEINIIGNHAVKDDLSIYSKGLLSSLFHILPDNIRKSLKRPFNGGEHPEAAAEADISVLRDNLIQKANSLKQDSVESGKLKDLISSGLYLIGR